MARANYCFDVALLPEGWKQDVRISCDDLGTIDAIETGNKSRPRIAGAVIPAMPNVHCHAHQRLMAGLAEKSGETADSFWTWREVMYGFALRLLPEDLEAVAAQAYVEMLKAGYSCVGEFHYLHHQPDGQAYEEPAEMALRCISAADQAGIAITMLPTLYAHSGFGGKAPAEGQRRFINSAESFLAIHQILQDVTAASPLRRLGISPHSLRAVTPELLCEVLHSIDDDEPVHIHVAEQQREVEESLAATGHRPVEFLLEHLKPNRRWCAIHATHLSETETNRLSASGVVAGLCPTTEANLGDGIFPASQFDGKIAIGSDSNVTISVAQELRQLEYSQRLRDKARNVLAKGANASTGRSLFDAALAGGAQALAQPVGAIAMGKRLDVAVLDLEHPSMMGRAGDQLLDSWIFSAGNAAVKDMIVAGEHLVQNRLHIREAEILQAFSKTIRRLT
jgi:formimidoylglutamate deiminase